MERGKPALVAWIDEHEREYRLGLLNGFLAADWLPSRGSQGPKDVTRDIARDLSGLLRERMALKEDATRWLKDPEYAASGRPQHADRISFCTSSMRWYGPRFRVSSSWDPRSTIRPPWSTRISSISSIRTSLWVMTSVARSLMSL